MRMNRAYAVIACLLIAFGLALAKPQTQEKTSPKTAVQQFKNIQVLKDIPADQLIPTMQFIAASLGVECDFCHVRNAFDKDEKKPKVKAREMMAMMITINEDNFNGERKVTCYSCHRGHTAPLAIPVVASADEKPTPNTETEMTNPASPPAADQVIDKYIHALGGADAIEKLTSFAAKGNIDTGRGSLPIDLYEKAPDMRVSFMHMPQGDSITVFNGHEGWLAFPQGPIHEMHGPDIDAAAMDADLHFAIHLKQMFTQAKVDGTEKIGDHETYVLVGEREGKTPLKLYFDQQSGLLVRLYRLGETALGELPTQIDYTDYRGVNSVKLPFEWTLARAQGRFTIKLSELQPNIPVDDAKFAKPQPPEQPHGASR